MLRAEGGRMRIALLALLAVGCGSELPQKKMTPCTPACAGKSCGGDGCGGSCGACMPSETCNAGACTPVSTGGADVTVDASAVGPAIHPEIYGLAFASAATVKALNVPLNRWGGNGTTLYNWQSDVGNTANDWYFENIPHDGEGTYGQAGWVSSSDVQIREAKASHADTLLTIPTIGWTPKDRVTQHPYTCSFPVSKFGAQQSTDQWDPNCGNGKSPSGAALTPDPTVAAKTVTPAFEASWVQHLVQSFGSASSGGVRFYALDNEMMLWDSTHADVHPMPVSYDEVWKTTTDYAPAIRAADPSATILGYGTWGVLDLFVSGLDGKNSSGDRQAHGDVPLAAWYLKQLAAYEKANGKRLVDCLDLHYYPQGGDPLETTRSLWDPSYTDPSWVNDFLQEPVQLFPRVQKWIDESYPGTGICVSEYNFTLNGETDPKAALVEADVLGLFGKYGVRLAAFWTTPVDDQGKPRAPYRAFQLYRNYDGAGGTFGATSVSAATAAKDLAVYAATDPGRLTVMLINKGGARTTTVAISGFAGASAQVYQSVSAGEPTRGADLAVDGGKLSVALPAASLTLLVVRN
jgi:hypothetical protein